MSQLRQIIIVLVALLAMVSCGSESNSSPIRLQANAVTGGQLFVDDLTSEDTVLWFWAPW